MIMCLIFFMFYSWTFSLSNLLRYYPVGNRDMI